MARIRDDQPLVPSVLDRLIDNEPGVHTEPFKSRGQLLRALRASVRRDLENLLNTRCRSGKLPEEPGELEDSLVNYGLPDFRSVNSGSSEGRKELAIMIQDVIRRFEPRFKRVFVELLDNADPLDRTLRFRVDGLLHAEPAPEPVVFDSALEPTTGNITVRGEG